MVDDRLASIEREIARLRVSFVESLTQRSADLASVWAAVALGTWARSSAELLHRTAHSLVGPAATFGFAPLGDSARTLTDLTHSLVHVQTAAAKDLAEIENALRAVQTEIATAQRG